MSLKREQISLEHLVLLCGFTCIMIEIDRHLMKKLHLDKKTVKVIRISSPKGSSSKNFSSAASASASSMASKKGHQALKDAF